jgi:RNA recognition motif-containing protein
MPNEKGRKLVVKISNPAEKSARSGARYDGRELYLVNIDWKASDEDLKEAFAQYGTIEKVHIERKPDGGSKGFGSIVFSSKDEANDALAMHEKMFMTRPLRVQLAQAGGPAKRTTNTVVSQVATAESSPAAANGTDTGDLEAAVGERGQRTIALMNIPDTVNEDRVRALVEPFGHLVKISLRPDHQGAIVEYVDIHDAGKASLALEGKEIAPGRPLHVGRVYEMMQQHAEKKTSKVTSLKHEAPTKKTNLQPTGPIKRPQQPGARGGRKGGLGLKRHTAALSEKQAHAPASSDKMDTTIDGDSSKPKKSNDDFRAMLQGSRPE